MICPNSSDFGLEIGVVHHSKRTAPWQSARAYRHRPFIEANFLGLLAADVVG
jgi:hypothetical protein